MSAAKNQKELIDDHYYKLFLQAVNKIKSGEITLEELKRKVEMMEFKIDEWAEDSEFFDLKKATKLLGQSESILQDLPSFKEEEKYDLLGAILYFVDEVDAIPDNTICGFDDDEIIMEAVLRKHNIKLV